MTPITITTDEGAFVFTGTDHDGSAKWAFLKRTPEGFFPGKAPRSVQARFEKQRREAAYG